MRAFLNSQIFISFFEKREMAVIDWIFPKECLRCDKVGDYLCFECRKSLNPHPELCPSCHRSSRGFATCLECRKDEKIALEGIIVGFAYEKWLKKLILKLKFYHKKDIGDFLAQRAELMILTHEKLSQALESGDLVISWVPSHWWRHYIEKGYNQSEILATGLAKRLGISAQQLAHKSKSTLSQLALKRAQRLENLKDAFVTGNLELIKKGSLIVLVDDVTTTGSTLNQLALSIKKSRPDLKIWGLVLARHMG